jgi:hypothetical protein
VIRTLIQSEITFVPPVTADRSPPDSRIIGALSRYELSRANENNIVFAELRRGHLFERNQLNARAGITDDSISDCFGLCFAQRVGLSLPPAFCHRFGEVRKQHREPKPERHLCGEKQIACMALRDVANDEQCCEDAPDLDDKHDRVLSDLPRIEFYECVFDCSPHDRRIK